MVLGRGVRARHRENTTPPATAPAVIPIIAPRNHGASQAHRSPSMAAPTIAPTNPPEIAPTMPFNTLECVGLMRAHLAAEVTGCEGAGRALRAAAMTLLKRRSRQSGVAPSSDRAEAGGPASKVIMRNINAMADHRWCICIIVQQARQHRSRGQRECPHERRRVEAVHCRRHDVFR
jgi:hypothetical protein